MADKLNMSYEERSELANNPAAKRLFNLMAEKETNLVLNDDVTTVEKFIELADIIGPEIAILKTHIDILENFTPTVIDELKRLSKKHNFLIFEDRKFADIGNTVQLQYSSGIYKISSWANFVNAHIITGFGIIESLGGIMKNNSDGLDRGIILLAQLTTKGSLATGEYTKKAVEMANLGKESVAGFISSSILTELKTLSDISLPGHIIFTPGVRLLEKQDQLDQLYSTPEEVISNGSDCILVGRGIINSENPLAKAKEYREAAWNVYLKRVGEK